MLPFQRTFISSYPKATQDTQRAITTGKQYGGTWFNLIICEYLLIFGKSESFGLSVHHIAYQQNVSKQLKQKFRRRKK